ncbi:hypothetical protein GJW-30_1_02087 [Variibacter gotjawalensis]|uniref:Uncharacterized protein n=1 Tax=Variibacter gotjawalensis TaxID=1333996 RepID=A0A0S3PUI0_9BRAD|nr:hypothetical protein [Variibacter gotjawalensis]NIK49880.1 glycerol-3-phosphate acyltransferase PlsY [Variibacter gotjawalensis]RZS45879.1 hypothetical protein EV661_4205 [Variibacter gotjawalensis]BAT59554.1 hypothetical protein GJW-30_1_02087 [Variibacter gotjawalensis]
MSLMRENLAAWVIAIAALLGAVVSLYNYVTPLTGIDGTGGALLVIVSSLILAGAAILLATCRLGTFLRRFLKFSALLDIAGTSFAAYLLETQSLLALMAVCFVAWLLMVFAHTQYSAPIAHQSKG